jgi:hypothetical protein
MLGLSDFHESAARGSGLPLKARAVAFSFIVPPTFRGALAGSMSMRAAGLGLTLMLAKPSLPPTIAPTFTSPGL